MQTNSAIPVIIGGIVIGIVSGIILLAAAEQIMNDINEENNTVTANYEIIKDEQS